MLFHFLSRFGLVSLCLAVAFNVNSQIIHLDVEALEGKTVLIDRSDDSILAESDTYRTLNYNVIFPIKETPELILPKNNSIQIFSVFDKDHDSEFCVWSLNSGNGEIITTDKRLIDLDQKRYINYSSELSEASLISYHHSHNKVGFEKIRFGYWLSDIDFPVGKLKGWLGESLVFDAILDPSTNRAQQSALILKYGLDLGSGLTQLSNSNGQVMWSGDSVFNFDLRAIARDDAMNLNQRQSKLESVNYEMALGLHDIKRLNQYNDAELEDLEYLLWSANDSLLSFTKDLMQQTKSETMWKTKVLGSFHDLNVQFNSALLSRESLGHRLWLKVVPETGDGLQGRRYYELEANGAFYAQSRIKLEDGDQLELIISDQFLIDYSMTIKSCEESGDVKAEMAIHLVGATAPYIVKLINQGSLEKQYMLEDGAGIVSFDQWGDYFIDIIDKEGTHLRRKINVRPSDVLDIEIPAVISLQGMDYYEIDISEWIDDSWEAQWHGPDGSVESGFNVKMYEEGIYSLILEKGQCHSEHEIQLLTQLPSSLSANVFPNPSSTGEVNIELLLSEGQQLDYILTDMSGRIVMQASNPASRYHSLKLSLAEAGVYFLKLSTVSEHSVHKLIYQP